MIGRTKVIKKMNYYLTSKEAEKIYTVIADLEMSVKTYAKSKGVGQSTFQLILNGSLPLTKDMYRRAFTDFDFIELPPSYKQ
jgi:hypothetical protein